MCEICKPINELLLDMMNDIDIGKKQQDYIIKKKW